MPKIKRALVSVSDKKKIVDFVKGLKDLGIEIISTGGTAKILQEAGVSVREVSSYTQSHPMFGGRVKTLHPKIHGALLALRDNSEQMEEVKRNKIELIDMVVVNLYPFSEIVKKEGVTFEEALENIDIGGPTMLRSAAKNFFNVAAVSTPEQYDFVLRELKENNGFLSKETCFKLTVEVFEKTSAYDSAISHFLEKRDEMMFPSTLNLSFKKKQELRYGENPHQKAALYCDWTSKEGGLSLAKKIWGKAISFNNWLDFDAALAIVKEFDEAASVVIKHNNPCGAGCGENLSEAYKKAYRGDPLSAFGSILSFNRKLDAATAKEITLPQRFIEGIIAPGYEKEALRIIKETRSWGRKVIILEANLFKSKENDLDIKRISGGVLVQEKDKKDYSPQDLKVVTKRAPTSKEEEDLFFAWKICKYVKSNAILLAKGKEVVGVGAGQMSRVDSTFIAIRKAGEKAKGSVLASDAFFPFPDAIEEASKAGVTAIIQPGGSIQDEKVITAVNRYGMAMIFTGMRHFRH